MFRFLTERGWRRRMSRARDCRHANGSCLLSAAIREEHETVDATTADLVIATADTRDVEDDACRVNHDDDDDDKVDDADTTLRVTAKLTSGGQLRRSGKLSDLRPIYAAYRATTERIRSFYRWPAILRPLVSDLVESGFFYSGHSDDATCHFCGCRLSAWCLTDSVPRRHSLANRHCPFAKASLAAAAARAKNSCEDDRDEPDNVQDPPPSPPKRTTSRRFTAVTNPSKGTNGKTGTSDRKTVTVTEQTTTTAATTSSSATTAWMERTFRVVTRSVLGNACPSKTTTTTAPDRTAATSPSTTSTLNRSPPYRSRSRYRRNGFVAP